MPSFKKKLRISYFILWGTVKRHKVNVLLIGLSVILTVVGLTWIISYLFLKRNADFVEGMVGQYEQNALPRSVEQLISVGLTKIDESGQAQPAAATGWEVQDQGKRFVFTLRNDLYWHDGTKFTAHDLNYLFDGVETKIDSDTQIEFILKNPYAPFPTVLAKPLLKGEKLLGLGNYRVASVEKSQNIITEITLVKRSDGYLKQLPADASSKVSFRFYPTLSDMVTAYKLGELKAMYGFFDSNILKSWRNYQVVTKPTYTSVVTAYFNTKDDILKEKTIRQALLYAIAPDSFPGVSAVSPIPPTSWAFNKDVKEYVFDINHGSELVKKAFGDSKIAPLTITTSQAYLPIANQLAQDWGKLGFEVNVIVAEGVPENYQILLTRQELPADPDQYALWHSLQQQSNYAHYSKDRIDKFLEDGRKTQDQDQRATIYQDFQRFIMEDAPAAFLYYPNESLLINKRFSSPFYLEVNGFR